MEKFLTACAAGAFQAGIETPGKRQPGCAVYDAEQSFLPHIDDELEAAMTVNKPVGDNARKGAVKKRTQLRTRLRGARAGRNVAKPQASSWR